jgi:hypothetical protein
MPCSREINAVGILTASWNERLLWLPLINGACKRMSTYWPVVKNVRILERSRYRRGKQLPLTNLQAETRRSVSLPSGPYHMRAVHGFYRRCQAESQCDSLGCIINLHCDTNCIGYSKATPSLLQTESLFSLYAFTARNILPKMNTQWGEVGVVCPLCLISENSDRFRLNLVLDVYTSNILNIQFLLKFCL